MLSLSSRSTFAGLCLLMALSAATAATGARAEGARFLGADSNGPGGQIQLLFFDTAHVERSAAGISVWVEGVAKDRLEHYVRLRVGAELKNVGLLGRANQKIRSGYVPPYVEMTRPVLALSKGEWHDLILDVTSEELAFESGELGVISRWHVEVDCAAHRVQDLTATDPGDGALRPGTSGAAQGAFPAGAGSAIADTLEFALCARP